MGGSGAVGGQGGVEPGAQELEKLPQVGLLHHHGNELLIIQGAAVVQHLLQVGVLPEKILQTKAVNIPLRLCRIVHKTPIPDKNASIAMVKSINGNITRGEVIYVLQQI